MTRIILNGYMGKMGRAVLRLAETHPRCEIVGGVDVVGTSNGLAFPTYGDIHHCERAADAVVDFSVVEAVPALLAFGIARQIPLVLCTTGLPAALLDEIRAASQKVAIFQSANMSLGINLLCNTLRRTAKLLQEAQFDIEIIEKHHNQKLDAPSGTALMLADTINQALESPLQCVYDRSGALQKRSAQEIGIHALRGGTIVGEHTVLFAGTDEVLEFTHIAQSKEVFAVGALNAAQFIKGKPPGLYTMQDLIESV